MKPIEPGCLALYSSETNNHGKPIAREVRVVSGPHDIGFGLCFKCGKGDRDWVVVGLPPPHNVTCECSLTRIDGGDPDAVTTETEQEVTA